MSSKKLVVRPLCTVECQGIKSRLLHFMAPDTKTKTASCMFYIEGADKNIIVDTGLSPELMSLWEFAGVSAKLIATPEDALKKVGLKCEDIDIVIFTHLHLDHTANVSKITRAKFIVQSAELTEALHPHPGVDSIFYMLDLYKDLKFVTVTGDQEISDGIKVMLTPGHTPGSQTILVGTEKGVVAIPGMCSVLENFYPPEPYDALTEFIPPGIVDNEQEMVQSMGRIKHTADIIVPIHDIKWSTVDRIP